MTAKVLIVDDQEPMRVLLAEVLETIGCEASTAIDGKDGIRQLYELKPDLVITDISMDGMNGLELTAHLLVHWPDLSVLISSTHEKEIYAGRAQQLGARGYIQKDEFANRGAEVIRCMLIAKRCGKCPYAFEPSTSR